MTDDIRVLLQKADTPSRELDIEIANFLGINNVDPPVFTTNYNLAISIIEANECDWIMGNVNGQVGGTPFARVACTDDKSSYSGTPLLSLWLSYARFKLGDERV